MSVCSSKDVYGIPPSTVEFVHVYASQLALSTEASVIGNVDSCLLAAYLKS